MSRSAELVHVTRGGLVESVHYGDVAVVDATGKLIAYAGAPREKFAFWRSSAKPFQAIPVIESGAAEKYNLTDKEVAVFTASHNGEIFHTDAVQSILKKIGLDESYLQCGVHNPLYAPRAAELKEAGIEASEIHNNCSGKHSGMLTLGKMLGADPSYYTELRHPVQQAMLQSVSEFTSVPMEEIPIGIDGCGVPVHGLSVYHMALAWARLINPIGMSEKRQEAAEKVRTAMMKHPEMVAGTGRLCTALMSAAPGKIVAKSGAEAIYGFAIPELGIGMSLKIADGGGRATNAAVLGVLRQLDYLSEKEFESLLELEVRQLKNHRQDLIGEVKPAVNLIKI
ncbi:MAG: asparaginase [Firmicutes bacterium]|jgi:L-asparaginase II|nr:asparaginase [Bacillota bacterium]